MKIQRRWLLIAAAAVFAATTVGCGSGDNNNSTASNSNASAGGAPKKKDKYTITLIAKSSTNPVFMSAKKGAEDAAAELSKQGPQVTIDWETPANEDGQVQATNIQNAVNSGSDAILMSCSDASKVTGAINDAVAKGVQVMTFDSDAADSKRFAFYGADDASCGQQVMDELGAQMGGKGQVAILTGNQNAPNLQKRVKGVQDELKAKFPGMTLVGTFSMAKETPEDATQKVQDTMKAYPQIQGWAMIGGWPLFATTLLTDLDPAKVKIVAVDALPQELAYVDKGIAPVLLAQPCYMWGYKPVHIIYDKIVNGKDPEQAVIKMPLVKITKANLGEWAQQLKIWGFTDVDPKYLAMAKDPGDIAKGL
ncbi:MAG TPA: substrate-binding domain-containing protein [Fimbriimonadaceae bacterium]|jgi:ribose transport system substrate-binding protein